MDGITRPETAPAAPSGEAVPATGVEGDEAHAQEFQRRIEKQKKDQFQRLKDEAKAAYGMVNGRPGVTSPREWEKLLEQAGDYIGNGRFLVQRLGAERYLDAETVAVLLTLRQNLIAELGRPSTAAMMMIDAAIVAYFNMVRVEGWIGNLALVVESDLFGNAPDNRYDGSQAAQRLQEQFRRLGDQMLPLLDKCHRMMVRSLASLPPSNPGAADALTPIAPKAAASSPPTHRLGGRSLSEAARP